MTIKEFVRDIVMKENRGLKRCYIAIMPMDGQFDLEVETVASETIGGTYRTDTSNLEMARKLANQMHRELNRRGVKVFRSRVRWESLVKA